MSIERKALDELKIDRGATQRHLPWGTILIVLIIIAVAAWGFVHWLKRQGPAKVRTAQVTQSAQSASKTVLNASGYVTARREATVSSKITGQIIEVLVEEGQKVEAGQIVAKLDPSNINTSLKLAKAQVDVARVALNETKTLLEQARRELDRAKKLADDKITSQSVVDALRTEADALLARIERQTSEIEVAERQVDYWRQQFDDTVIRAPFAGVVIVKNAQPGEIISPISAGGGFTRTGICTIVDMASLEIEVDVNENYINRVRQNQPVEAVLDAYQDWKIPAKVIAIIPAADRQKATVKVRVGFESPDPRILPDMGVKVSFQNTDESAPAAAGPMTAPAAAIRKEGQHDILLFVRDGKIERRAVKLGRIIGDRVEVLSNVASGESVIVEGPQDLKDGSAVEESAP